MRNNLCFEALDYTFNLHLRPPITVIMGHTSSGKTFLCHCLKEAGKDSENKENLSNIVLFEHDLEDIESIRQKENKLIILDNADRLLADNVDLIDYIATDTRNQYVIISRCLYEFNVSPNHYATIINNKKEFSLHYKWNEAR